MLRFIAILGLLLAAMPRAGVGSDRTEGPERGCWHAECRPVAAISTCCGGGVGEGAGHACPISGSACRCGASPGPPQPRPEAPAPKPGAERYWAPAAAGQRTIPAIAAADALRAPETAAARTVRGALTHNGLQALLGVWQM